MSLSDEINALIYSQIEEWPQAATGFGALQSVQTRDISVPGIDVRVQFNPARMVSTGAKIDAVSVKARKCFLCEANRPEAQRGIAWGDHYTILVNPFPIFPRHLTIPDDSHIPQQIKGRICDMVQLSMDLEGYTIFYNGPKCGASAPDHMHFQAGNSDFLPFWNAIENDSLKTLANESGTMLSISGCLPFNVFVIEGTSSHDCEALFDRLYEALPQREDETEPMMNVLCRTIAGRIELVVIPRKKHRPSFYGTDEGCMVLSPASVDLGGVFITPRAEDYANLDSSTVQKVYDELCLSLEEIKEITKRLN